MASPSPSPPPPLRVAIIGAGVSGITTAKCCLEAHTTTTAATTTAATTTTQPLEVTVYERSHHIGGLWRFRPEIESGIGSVAQFTIVNSSKEMTAFSDYPVPEWYPNFMHNKWMIKYLQRYAESFDFYRVVKFGYQVQSIVAVNENDDDEKCQQQQQNGVYRLVVKHLDSGTCETVTFDAVAICTGHNHTPKWPYFPGMHQFTGELLHSHQCRVVNDGQFDNKRIVIVGVGNSAGDLAAELASRAAQVYVSTRRGGTWLIRRTGLGGYPIDTLYQRRLFDYVFRLLPYRAQCAMVETTVNQSIGHRLLGIRPKKTRFFSQHIMVNDHLPTGIHLGQIRIRPNISHFTPDGVMFEGATTVTPCDVVIFSTGYRLSFPFLPHSLVKWNPNGRIKLYKHVFDPCQQWPDRLAFIGLTQPIGSLPPLAELQARWFVALLTGQCAPLPSRKKMFAEIEHRRAQIRHRYGVENEHRYTFQTDWLPYADSIAKSAGIKPNLWRYLMSDRKLWYALLTGPSVPAQYRLCGPGAKPALAREVIMGVRKRIKAPYRDYDHDHDPNQHLDHP